MTELRDFFHLLVDHETTLWNAVDRRLTTAGALSLGRLMYLRVLDGAADVRIQDIAAGLGTTVGAASRLTDRLVGDGLVERFPHPSDRRSAVVRATDAGAEARRTAEVEFDAALTEVLGAVDRRSIAVLTDGLRVLAAEVTR